MIAAVTIAKITSTCRARAGTRSSSAARRAVSRLNISLVGTSTPMAIGAPSGVLVPTNEMFNLETARRAALEERVPARALHVLVIFAIVTAAIMGHGLAHGRRRHLVSTSGLYVLVAMAISLIIDLDSPRIGSVRVPQTPMEQVAREVEAIAAALPALPKRAP